LMSTIGELGTFLAREDAAARAHAPDGVEDSLPADSPAPTPRTSD